MDLRYKIKNLDKGEKDFLLVALAFVLILIFVLSNGSLFEKHKEIVVNFGNVGDDVDLTELQAASCRYASQYNSCDKLSETYLISTEVCCKKRGECC